MDNLTFHRF